MEEGIQQLLQAEHNHREDDQRGGSRTGVQGGHRQNHEVLHGWAGAQLTGLMVSYPLPPVHLHTFPLIIWNRTHETKPTFIC